MTGFFHSDSGLLCDGIPLSAIAAAAGTPVYVYSAADIRRRYRELDEAFANYPHRIHYALKANSTLAIARALCQAGSAADANSIWEIEVARKAGFTPADIVFTGVGKAPGELECAVTLGLKAINVESTGELERIEALAAANNRVVAVAIRVNPDIDANSHPHISTGRRINKFGVPSDTARQLIQTIAPRRWVKLVAIHAHVGSQITSIDPLRRAAAFLAHMAGEIRSEGIELEYLDLGGGLGIAYRETPVASSREYAQAVLEEVAPTKLPIVIEPGRSIVGPAGVLVARVVDLKPKDADSEFAVIDAGMSELMRPVLYDAFHRIEPVQSRAAAERVYEIVGPICESSDVMGRDRRLPQLAVGDLVAIRDAGAYGSAMASNYNRRPLPAEVVVDDGHWTVARRRQTVDDLLSLER
jgi:diaminopimelate decarboxylase